LAPAYLFFDDDGSSISSFPISSEEVTSEYSRFLEATEEAKFDVGALRDKARSEAGEEQAAIFDAHLMMLDDPEMKESVRLGLSSLLMNAESVIFSLEREMIDKLSSSQDPYMQERASDIHDVVRRVLRHLLHREHIDLAGIDRDVILVAKELLPSDMVTMIRSRIKGIVTESGGRTSHAAILARLSRFPPSSASAVSSRT